METKVQQEQSIKPKKSLFRVPDAYVILFILLIVCAVATYIVPAGEFERVQQGDITVVNPESFHKVEQSPVSVADIFLSYPKGMIATANIIILVLFIGGAFAIMEASGAVSIGIMSIIKKLENKRFLLISVLGIVFSLLCTTGFSANATIAFVPIGLLIARALKLDAIAAVAIVFVTSMTGFNTAFLNPKTLGIAQHIAELPMFSGMVYRVILYVIFAISTILYIFWYCNRISKDPSKSYMGEKKFPTDGDSNASLDVNAKFTARHALIIAVFVGSLAFYVFGALTWDWGVPEMTALFLIIGIASGIIARMNSDEIVSHFMKGAQSLVYGALIIGASRAVLFILEDGHIIDTIVHGLATILKPLSPVTGSIGMLWANAIFNFFVPSGSGQAVVTMPIWTPLADILDINRQVAVQAFQLGDGFTNSLFPTSGILMASLAIAGVPYGAWVKFIWRLILIWLVLGSLALTIGVLIDWGPF